MTAKKDEDGIKYIVDDESVGHATAADGIGCARARACRAHLEPRVVADECLPQARAAIGHLLVFLRRRMLYEAPHGLGLLTELCGALSP